MSIDLTTITVRSPAEHKRAAREALLIERDAMGAEVRERWPGPAGEIVSLLTRLEAVDRKIRTLNPALDPADRLELVEPPWRHEPQRPGESIHPVPSFQPGPLYLTTEIPALRPGDPSHLIPWNHRR